MIGDVNLQLRTPPEFVEDIVSRFDVTMAGREYELPDFLSSTVTLPPEARWHRNMYALGMEAELEIPIAIQPIEVESNCNSNSTVSVPVVAMVAISVFVVEVVTAQFEKAMQVLLVESQPSAISASDNDMQHKMK